MGEPIRTCKGCGRKRSQDELIRFTPPGRDGAVVGRRLEGRGYYLCPSTDCLKKLAKRRRRWFPDAQWERIAAEIGRVLDEEKG